jgi:hypothetical protein
MGALPEGSNRQRTTFLSSINKDYEGALVKDEEDPAEDSYEE